MGSSRGLWTPHLPRAQHGLNLTLPGTAQTIREQSSATQAENGRHQAFSWLLLYVGKQAREREVTDLPKVTSKLMSQAGPHSRFLTTGWCLFSPITVSSVSHTNLPSKHLFLLMSFSSRVAKTGSYRCQVVVRYSSHLILTRVLVVGTTVPTL